MTHSHCCAFRFASKFRLTCVGAVLLVIAFSNMAFSQETLGAMNGTVTDASGAVIQGTAVKIHSKGTNLEVTALSKTDGSFSVVDLPIGTYEITFTKDGFQSTVYPQILVQGNRTTTVNAKLKPGAVSTRSRWRRRRCSTKPTPPTATRWGHSRSKSVPLGTGSFTQLAIQAPGVSADFLSGSGSNEGLGNQGIVANGQRDTSNLFTFNGVNANNLFNGNSTSNISDSRFTLNTGEIFGVGGQVQTNSSVFDAIGQALAHAPGRNHRRGSRHDLDVRRFDGIGQRRSYRNHNEVRDKPSSRSGLRILPEQCFRCRSHVSGDQSVLLPALLRSIATCLA